jgi:rubrerythrin
MEKEQGKILKALQFAIQMEIDGKAFYRKASKDCDNKVAERLYDWLATEEDSHRKKFEEIYKSIKDKKGWPEIDIQPKETKGLITFFSGTRESVCPIDETPSAELEVAAKAMDMENKTHEFYKSQGEKAAYDAEKKFYLALAAEERGHYLTLVDYREYLVDPAGWFRKAEHHSLDGG